MTDKKESGIHGAISRLLVRNLEKFKDKALTSQVCLEIYQTVFDTLAEVFVSSKVNISNETMNWLAQAYYDSITINENQELDPNVFTQRAKLENIETRELALMATALRGTGFFYELVHEIRRRN